MITILFLLVCLMFCRIMMMCFRRRFQRDYHPCVVLSTKLILFREPHFPTGHPTGPIPKRRKKFSNKYKRFWIKGIFVSVLALVLFLLFWFLRKMVHGVCA